MPHLEKRWQVAARISPEAEESLKEYPPVLRQVLYNRGYSTAALAERYLRAAPPDKDDPFALTGMAAAVDRIEHAIRNGERIVVYGDYDADGVTATALLVDALTALGAQVQGYIPDRFDEGYGLNKDALSYLKEQGNGLVVTVDCGIRSLAEAEHARGIQLDLIITDHHTPGPELPDALAVVNAKQPGDEYADKNLAGVGTAYKLACALFSRLAPNSTQTDALLDLVALGTVADLVPLIGENRALVRHGLQLFRTSQRQGLHALMGVAGVRAEQVTAGDVGYMLGPRLNAAGRVASALDAFHLLTTTDFMEAGRIAQDLDNRNRERQTLTRETYERSEELATQDPNALLLFAADPGFNPGVVGLAASRLVETYYRPAIVAHQGQDATRASCRSISEFHITEALEQCAELLVQFGGHAAAAGFTVKNENLNELIKRLNIIARQQLGKLDLRPTLHADAEVSLGDLKPELIGQMQWLEPTGYGNPDAKLVTRGAKVQRSRTVGKDGTHLKLAVTDGRITYEAIAFRQGHWQGSLPAYVDLLFTYEMNEYNGRQDLQLNVKDIKPAV